LIAVGLLVEDAECSAVEKRADCSDYPDCQDDYLVVDWT
jgi:hypothetical protein